MSEIEKMKKYIERTKMPISQTSGYQMNVEEAFELCYQAWRCPDLPMEMISLAFKYGQAKGYRAAKAKMKEATT